MTEFNDKLWNKQYQKLVEFQGKNGHCIVPRGYKEDKSLGKWADTQRGLHANNTIRPGRNTIQPGRKDLLDDIGFVWRVKVVNSAPSQQQYEKLAEFKHNNGHCIVPAKYKEDASLGFWVSKQRQLRSKNKIRLDREVLLDEIDFVWKADTLAAAARSSTTNVRGLIIASFHALFRIFF
jgi:hypothetical protein